jgi:hypothetical protein
MVTEETLVPPKPIFCRNCHKEIRVGERYQTDLFDPEIYTHLDCEEGVPDDDDTRQ